MKSSIFYDFLMYKFLNSTFAKKNGKKIAVLYLKLIIFKQNLI